MSSISTTLLGIGNDRARPQQPAPGHQPPKCSIEGTVEFNIVADEAKGTISLEMTDVSKTNLVGRNSNNEYFLRVEADAVVQFDLVLAGPWQWAFLSDGSEFTLGSRGHAKRYWLTATPNAKTRRIVVESSKLTPVHQADDNGKFDEKFNLTVLLTQANSTKQLVIEIDPITKNPPPVDSMIVQTGVPSPII